MKIQRDSYFRVHDTDYQMRQGTLELVYLSTIIRDYDYCFLCRLLCYEYVLSSRSHFPGYSHLLRFNASIVHVAYFIDCFVWALSFLLCVCLFLIYL